MNLSTRNIKGKLKIKIKKCIKLLGKEYTSLNYVIYFYDGKEKLQKEQFDKPNMEVEQYDQIINGQTEIAGVTLGEKGIIKIFLFVFEDVEKRPEEVIHLVGNLYHEIRHAWQYENKLFKKEEEVLKIDGDTEAYFQLDSEKDAYKFQKELMKKHGNRILETFGFANLNIEFN